MKNFLLLTTIYIAVLCFMGGIACFFSYQQKKSEVLLEMNMTFEKLELEYLNILDNFWQIYMPIFESVGDNYIHSLLTEYYIPEKNTTLSPLDKRELAAALNQMMLRDDQIKWIALYSEDREYNYILFQGSSNLNELTNNFPYLDQIASSPSYMSVWGTETITDSGTTFNTYAICGGVPANMGNGRIVVGYNITALEQICKNSTVPLASLNYRLTSDQDILFDSSGDYDENTGYIPTKNMTENIHLSDGAQVYVNSVISGNNTSVISYTVLWKELLRYFHVYTLPILLVVFLFCGVSLILYATMLRMITKEVNTIRMGLENIGDNNLDYRIPTHLKQGGLSAIAESINHMTISLKDNINKAYHFEISQKEAELAELQAKFNPHFLYNSLEMLCSRCYQSGDEETAELITQLAAIFRGFIGTKTFIPITDELTFSKRYLALFGARYGEQVKIQYDIDTDILQYGVIRNIFQPLIENYYVHGFDTSEEYNYIRICGKSLSDNMKLLAMEDNGYGMSDEEMSTLNVQLHQQIEHDTESYGLKNLHQRLQLFYGKDCGLTITRNEKKGMVINMKLLKLTCEEYEQSRK